MKRSYWFCAFGGALLICGWIGYQFALEAVTIQDGGTTTVIETRAFYLGEALAEAGITLGSSDQLDQDLNTWEWNLPDSVEIDRAATNLILDGSEQKSLVSTAKTCSDLLAEAGVQLNKEDRVYIDGQEGSPNDALPQALSRVIQIVRAVSITIDEDGQTRTIQSSASSLGKALWDAGVVVDPGDQVSPTLDTPLFEEMPVHIQHARPISVQVGGQTFSIHTAAQTVGDALIDAGLPLQGLDYSLPAEDQPIEGGQTIQVVQVRESLLVAQDYQSYDTEYQLDDQTELDHQSVIQAGSPGLTITQERVRVEDGQEVARSTQETWQALDPQTEIIGTGTKVVIHKEVVDGEEIEYWRKLTVYATSYSPCRVGGDTCDSGTASGMPVERGTIAVTVDWFLAMRGQGLYVPGYGKGYIGDTGGGIDGTYWIDLAYSEADYVSWHQWVTIYFLTPVPAYVPTVLYP